MPHLSRFFRNIRSRLKRTVSALKGSPSWKRTPWRSVNSQRFSLTARQASASPGCGLPAASTSTRLSKTWRI
jgi:hypothetical protein